MKLLARLLILAAVTSALGVASAQVTQEVVGQPWTGASGITESVAQIMSRKAVPPKGVREAAENEEAEEGMDTLQPNPDALQLSAYPPLLKRGPGGGGNPGEGPLFSIGASWLGGGLNQSGYIPPDSEGAIGPTQFLMCVNGIIKVFDRNGNVGPLNTTTSNFFSSVRNNSTPSDPRVRFDRLTQKFYVVMINTSNPNRVMIAVSSGPVISSQSSFTFYQFTIDQVAPTGDNGGLFDYPSFGMDQRGIYIGGNIFNTATAGSTLFVVRKSSIQSGGPIVVSVFRNINGGGERSTPMGVENDDPNATFGYVVSTTNSSGTLRLFRISNPDTSPVLSAPVNFNVLSMADPNSIPALGSSANLDSIDRRLIGAQLRTNTLTGVQTLWTSHQIRINSSGVASGSGDRVGVRWYEIGNVTGTPTLVQAGTIFDPSANKERRWFGSITMTGQGNALVGSSASGPSRRASIAANYRNATDPLGTMAEQTVIESTSNYNVQSSTQRWGDYSHTMTDPTDNMTMWSVVEYCDSTNSWGVRIFSVLAPPPATITTVSPNSAGQGSTVSLVVSGSSVNGSGFYDPDGTYPKHLSATVSGTGVSVNSVSFDSPTKVTLNVTVAANAPTGARDITITNPDGQSTTASGALLVTGGGIVVSPSSFVVNRGTYIGGDISSVSSSDDVYLRFQPGPVLNNSEAPIDLTFSGTSSTTTPSSLILRVEAKSSVANVSQRVQLFNYQTSAFEEVDVRPATTSDSPIDITISSNAGRFVGPSGQLQARVSYKTTGPVLSYPYQISIDQIRWTIAP